MLGQGLHRTPQEVEQTLLQGVHEAERELRKCTGISRKDAEEKYRAALQRFNNFVIDGKLCNSTEE